MVITNRVGRPKGSLSGKYLDDSGKPIGVYAWRRLNGKGKISSEVLLKLLCEISGKRKDEIMEEALRDYLKNNWRKDWKE